MRVWRQRMAHPALWLLLLRLRLCLPSLGLVACLVLGLRLPLRLPLPLPLSQP